MTTFYEAPKAEIISFASREKLAVIEEDLGSDPEVEITSRDF